MKCRPDFESGPAFFWVWRPLRLEFHEIFRTDFLGFGFITCLSELITSKNRFITCKTCFITCKNRFIICKTHFITSRLRFNSKPRFRFALMLIGFVIVNVELVLLLDGLILIPVGFVLFTVGSVLVPDEFVFLF